MRPALRYHGGKWKLASWIISHFPEHRTYVELYGGGGSVLLRKPRSYAEIYNELDGEIVNVFRMLRDNGLELKRVLTATPFARAEFDFASHQDAAVTPLERARRTIIKSFMGFGSDSIKRKSGFRANSKRSGTSPAHDWANYADCLDELVTRLRGIVIENRNALDLFQQHDAPTTLFYADPPYVHSTRTASKRYAFEMTDDDHRKLATALHGVQGKVIVSGYDCPLYQELYAGWRVERKDALADGARKREECLWLNF